MSIATRDTILHALDSVPDPLGAGSVVRAGRISGVTVKDGKAGFLITLHPKDRAEGEMLRRACELAVAALPGISSVTAVLTAHNAEPIAPRAGGPYTQPRERAVWNLTPVEGVKRVLAVASGKGGVGKSTTAVNLALAAAAEDVRTGLLDADIYGPSLPRMLGLMGQGQPAIEGGKMLPPQAHGIACMSMGFIVPDQAAILRGPMISKTLHQLLRSTRWDAQGTLDLLLVDMPPGTGDIHLSLVQQVPLAGALIVTTPQEVAVMDARKCAQTFEKLGVPIAGIIENMSWFTDPAGTRHALFGEGGAARLAGEFGAPLLGQIALEPALRLAADEGRNFIAAHGRSEAAEHYRHIIRKLL